MVPQVEASLHAACFVTVQVQARLQALEQVLLRRPQRWLTGEGHQYLPMQEQVQV